MLTEEERIIEIFKSYDALWVHSGDPKDPHAELTSGLCSNAYYNCSNVLCEPALTEELAEELCHKLYKAGLEENYPDWVVGSAYAAITFSYEVAKWLGAKHAFAEKTSEPHKMSFKRVEIPEGSVVLQVEELITTMGTVNAVRGAIVRDNPYPVNFLPFIGTIVYRPAKLDENSHRIISLIEQIVWSVPPEECPLCKEGSVRYQPKKNWAKLTQR
ncbi:MAG: hypothetical protein PHO90_00785 [Candidatus Pacebacteria bacterium]|nr:hypothetical protein [Candidatus Paceibacterota bacterium]